MNIFIDTEDMEERYGEELYKEYLEKQNKELQQQNQQLHNKIDKAIDVIHTQMKNNPSYKENLKIIEITLIKGSCKVCDLKESDVDE